MTPGHRTILIFGTGRPVADRLAYYLRHYAEERKKPITVVQATAGDPNDMEWVQSQIWGTYTTEKGTQRPTMVINAHYTDDVNRLTASPEYAFRTNTHPAANIAIAARSADVPMIQISTDQVFRGNKGPYAVDDEPMPVNMFGISMVHAERAVTALYPTEWRGGPDRNGVSIVRLSWLYGKDTDMSPAGEGIDAEPDVTFHPTFIGEATFLIARNIVESSQVVGHSIIHCSTITEPTSWYRLLTDAGKHPRPIKRFGGPIGPKAGLIPSKGWVLPQDYQKGFNEFMHEIEHDSFVSYW